jgi:hypothetical protein
VEKAGHSATIGVTVGSSHGLVSGHVWPPVVRPEQPSVRKRRVTELRRNIRVYPAPIILNDCEHLLRR